MKFSYLTSSAQVKENATCDPICPLQDWYVYKSFSLHTLNIVHYNKYKKRYEGEEYLHSTREILDQFQHRQQRHI